MVKKVKNLLSSIKREFIRFVKWHPFDVVRVCTDHRVVESLVYDVVSVVAVCQTYRDPSVQDSKADGRCPTTLDELVGYQAIAQIVRVFVDIEFTRFRTIFVMYKYPILFHSELISLLTLPLIDNGQPFQVFLDEGQYVCIVGSFIELPV